MPCKINNNVVEWEILHKHIIETYKYLYLPDEQAGEIIFDTHTRKSIKINKKENSNFR